MRFPFKRNQILFTVSIALFFLLACNAQTYIMQEAKSTLTATFTQIIEESTTTPTQVPPTSTPQPTPTQVPQDFFTTEFDEEPENWSHFSINGENSVLNKNTAGVNLYSEDGSFNIDIERKLFWVYSVYNGFDYADVRIDAKIANRGTNNNNISLLCRYSEEYGWFEFNITNSGLYNIYFALPHFDGYVSYTELAIGGSNAIKQGMDTNTYTTICNGSTLTLMINDKFVREIDAVKFDLPAGKIGVSASSFMDIPVKIKIDSVTVSQP